MDIIEVIKKRKSCRSYNYQALTPSDKKALNDFIKSNSKCIDNESIDLIFIEKGFEDKPLKLNYGMIQGQTAYILGKLKATQASRLNYGYLMEKIVLKATELGISTCWIGYFDENYFNEITIEAGYEIPGIVIAGYSKEKSTLSEKITRLTLSAAKRQAWSDIFFDFTTKAPLTTGLVKNFIEPLEMLRLAPSAGNTQPWRAYYDSSVSGFHFYKKPLNANYEAKGLHDIDMGIALAHFHLACEHNGISGSYIKQDITAHSPIGAEQYIISWICK